MRNLLCFAVLLFVSTAFAGKFYLEYELYEVSINNEHEREIVLQLINDGLADPFKHDKEVAHVLMKKEDRKHLSGLEHVVLKTGEEIQERIDSQMRSDPEVRHNVDYTTYNTLDEIYEFYYEIAAANPSLVTIDPSIKTFEGRDLIVVDVINDPGFPLILLDSGIHAREWITPATMMYFFENALLDPEIMGRTNLKIVPVLNPDGYEFTMVGDRLWRKTRSDHDLACLGVDGNRNFDFQWGVVGASNSSCSDTYMGPSPLSEPEFQAIADMMNANSDSIKAYLTLHSYGQKIMYPFGHTYDPPPTQPELDRVAALGAAAIKGVHNTSYTWGSTADILGYLNSGTSRDYAYGAVGLDYTYTFELRDEGQFGFLLPENQILPTAQETYQGMKAIIQAALDAASP